MKRAIVGLVAACFIAGCGPAPIEGHDSPTSEAPSLGRAKYSIAVVPKGLTHQFWVTVKAGADAAGQEFEAAILWNGPAKETEINEQLNILEDMVNQGVDAIVMAATHENALDEFVEATMEKGIPVVTIDSGVETDAPISFVATDNIAGANAAADTLAELIGGSGKVGQLPFVPGAATSELREQGFEEGIASYPDIEIVATLYSHSDVTTAMEAMEDMMTSNPDLKGVFAANEASAIGAAQAVRAAGKVGEVKIVAFDAAEDEITALEDGVIQALIVQDPFRMGYEGVKAAVDHLEGRDVPKRIDTGVVIVTRDNLNDPEVQRLLNPEGAAGN